MKKHFIGCIFFALASFVFTAGNSYAYVEKNTAIVRVLNKAACVTQTVNLPVGEMVGFEKINILARTCKQADSSETDNFYAFVEITKSDGTKFFSNWMDRDAPGKNPVENADYDVWLVSCE